MIDCSPENVLKLEYADGSSERTSGAVRDVRWTVGHSTVLCDFHVLDDLCVDLTYAWIWW